MNKKSLFKRLFATLTSLTVLATCTVTTAFFANADEEATPSPTPYNMEVISDTQRIYSGENYEVDYSITSAWDNNQMISVTVTNTGTEPIGNWSLFYDFGGEIANIYNAEIKENDYFSYVAHTSNNFGEITPNSSTNFGYTLVGAESNYFPDSVDMVQSRQEITEGLTIELTDISNNYDTFGGQLILANTTNNQICMPEITINANFSLLSNWGYDIINLGENSYTIKSKFDTGIFINIPPNSSYTLQISGSNVENPQIESFSATELKVSVEEYAARDSDGDTLPDYYENEIYSDKYNPDTDGDLLIDGYEEFALTTSPLLSDTDANGISDADEDSDTDNLTNLQEYEIGTRPKQSDTDYDGLLDSDEINFYFTNPCEKDTDIDGMSDGTEVYLGIISPILSDSDSDGILDGDEVFEQTLKPDQYSDFVLDETGIIPEISITGAGDFNEKIRISDVEESCIWGELNYKLGHLFDIGHYEELIFESSTISFTISNDLIDIYGIDDIGIFTFNSETSSIELLDTSIVAFNKISAEVTHYSIYGAYSKTGLYNTTYLKTKNATLEKSPIDIVFIVDTTGSMGNTITNVKNNINSFVDSLSDAGIMASLGLVEYRDIYADGLGSTKKHGRFETTDEFKNKLGQLSANGGGDWEESTVDALDKAYEMVEYSTVPVYFLILTDASYKNGTTGNPDFTMLEEIEVLKQKNIKVSLVTSDSCINLYSALVNGTNGMTFNIYNNFATELFPFVNKVNIESGDDVWVRLSSFQWTKLDKDPSLGDRTVDSDGDGIVDLDELTEKVTVKNYINPYDYYEIDVWRFNSNPGLEDSDGDGILDGEDMEDLYYPLHMGDYYYLTNTIGSFDIQSPDRRLLAEEIIYKFMRDIDNHPNLDIMLDDEWLYFCSVFNSFVEEMLVINEEIHYFRNKLNRYNIPKTLDEMINLINSTEVAADKWIMCSPHKGRYHMFGEDGDYNIKFISPDSTGNIFEAVYDKNGNLITENDSFGKNMGTYNYASSSQSDDLHKQLDVKPYETWGNTVGDTGKTAFYVNQNYKKSFKKNKSAKEYYKQICYEIGAIYSDTGFCNYE
jgi:hypothetical protein